MSSKLTTSLFLLLALLTQFPSNGSTTNLPLTECPYPCLPPPTAPTVTDCPPPPPSQSGVVYTSPPPPPLPYSYPQTPPGTVYYPPPTGYYPYNSPPYYNNMAAPPPPNPILPYFPFIFRSPPGKSAASPRVAGAAATVLFSLLLHLFFLGRFLF